MGEWKSICPDQLFFNSFFPIEFSAQVKADLEDQETLSPGLYPPTFQEWLNLRRSVFTNKHPKSRSFAQFIELFDAENEAPQNSINIGARPFRLAAFSQGADARRDPNNQSGL